MATRGRFKDEDFIKIDGVLYKKSEINLMRRLLDCQCTTRLCELRKSGVYNYFIHFESELRRTSKPFPNYEFICRVPLEGTDPEVHTHSTFSELQSHKRKHKAKQVSEAKSKDVRQSLAFRSSTKNDLLQSSLISSDSMSTCTNLNQSTGVEPTISSTFLHRNRSIDLNLSPPLPFELRDAFLSAEQSKALHNYIDELKVPYNQIIQEYIKKVSELEMKLENFGSNQSKSTPAESFAFENGIFFVRPKFID